MKLLRNPEVKSYFIRYAIFTVLAVLGGLAISVPGGVYTGIICVTGGIACYFFTRRRYQKIAVMNEGLDQILHGDYTMNFMKDQEGELAILSTEIVKMTIRLREQAEMLEKDKVYLSNSIADISHQLRTPLTSIRMITPRLQREGILPEERIRMVQEVNSLLSRVDWLIASLLKISQLESGTVHFHLESVRVGELMKKAMEPLEIPLELKEQKIVLDIPDEISYRGDFLWSVEAVGNIIKNCMEYTPFGGSLHIKAEENPIFTQIVISDSGGGIAPEDLPHLFERFYKGKGAGKGSIGIGLALTQMIISRQNGTVHVQNMKNGGAEFHIFIYKGAV